MPSDPAANDDTRRMNRRQTILLAQLPYVGTKMEVGAKMASSLPLREALQSPPNQFVPPIGSDSIGTKRFVDANHSPPQQSTAELSTSDAQSQLAKNEKRQAISHGQTTLSTFFQLQSQIAPYAGLIVALALTLCAGLLFWIVSGPPIDPIDYPSAWELKSAELGSQPLNLSPSNSDVSMKNAPWATAESFEEPFESASTQPLIVEMPPVDDPVPPFPQTNRPLALDFSELDTADSPVEATPFRNAQFDNTQLNVAPPTMPIIRD